MDNFVPNGPLDSDNAPAVMFTLAGITAGDKGIPAIVDNAAMVMMVVFITILSIQIFLAERRAALKGIERALG